ncbi:MAG: CHAT domain-containing protein, partial [Rivularia sp. ALOHA_DT_140]|nr:CHAT domain-containing protein [Rivularia sp. ALOHA_DT_140]
MASILLRSIAIREKVLGKEHPDVAISLNNLAILYESQGNYKKAEPLYLRSLAIKEKVLGKEHPQVATILNNLALLYNSQENYAKAESLYLRSLAIKKNTLGKEHPEVATSLNNLGLLYYSQKTYAKAESFYLRSLAIWEKVLGKEHPQVANVLHNLTMVNWLKDNISRTTNFLARQLEIEEKNLQLIYAVGSEQRKQNYVKTFTVSTDNAISLALNEDSRNHTTAKLALITVLRRKGRVLDAITNTVQILRAQLADNPEIKTLFNNWLSVQQQLANLVYDGQEEQKSDRIKELEARKERLEEQVSAKSAEFRKEIQPIELKAIQAKIPQDAALIEIIQYEPFYPQLRLYLEPRYAAAILRSKGEPTWVDLGDAATIDKSIKNFRKVLVSPTNYGSQGEKKSRELDKLIMAPIRPLLGDARHLLLSPDGQLNLIPFEALKNEKNKYLVERYSFSYLTTGRDLLRFDIEAKQVSNPVIFANINYEGFENTVIAKNKNPNSKNQRSIDFKNLNYDSLPGTLVEGEAIKKIFTNINFITGKQATESTIKQLKSPIILHLATHGFFLPNQNNNNDKIKNSKNFKLENPLLRSGLALAGFNNRQNKQNNNTEDGVLTALEVAGLNLRGTKL